MKLKKGFVQVYTGNGKGKTTASLGLCLRGLGAGMKIFYAQFIKGKASSEFRALERFGGNFTHRMYGKGNLICGKPNSEDIKLAKGGLEECSEALSSGQYDIVVMDEANCAVKCGLFSLEDLISAIKSRNSQTEVIITGRNAYPHLIELADLVTEMKKIKHYHKSGKSARVGIEK